MTTVYQNPGKMVEPSNASLPVIPIKEKPVQQTNEIQSLTKLPSIYIPTVQVSKSPNLHIHLTDFLGDNSDTFKSDVKTQKDLKVNILARDKAIQLLQQYNELVGDKENLAVKNLPPIKVSIRPSGANVTLKKEKMTKKIPVFTEGISSISKRPDPFFTVPKESVIRANLPKNVIVAQKKNQFTFGVKSKSKKKRDEQNDQPQFKQMRKLGLDNMPSVDMGRYMNKSQLIQESINYRNGVKGGYFKTRRKSNGHKNDEVRIPLDSNLMQGSVTERPRGTISSRKNYNQNTARSDSKLSVVSVGETLSPQFFTNQRKLLRNERINWRFQQDEIKNLNLQDRDPSIYGVCSLAPIRVGGPINRLRTLDPLLPGPERSNRSLRGTKKKSKKQKQAYSDVGPWRGDTIKIPSEYQPENEQLAAFDNDFTEERSDSLTSYQQELLMRKTLNSPSGSETTVTTHTHINNPPPSYVSSTDEDYFRFDNPRAMLQIQEERSNLTQENTEINNMFTSLKDQETESIATSNSVARRKHLEGRRSKIQKEAKIVNLEMGGESGRTSVIEDGLFLSVPTVYTDKERRPPGRETRPDVDSVSRNYNDSQATWYSVKSDNENTKLTVKNIKLFNEQNENLPGVTPEISVTSENSETEVLYSKQDLKSSKENLTRLNTEEEFKKFTMSNKTLQFISPLEVMENAKRH